ncbi:MAG: helix-turn-helix domain-containing protein, partial [Candidatus Paceibacterota bacterium]
SRHGLSDESIKIYSDNLNRIIDIRLNEEKEESVKKLSCTPDAEEEILNYTQDLVYKQDTAPVMVKEYLSKLQINIHKMVLLIHLIKECSSPGISNKINVQTVKEAIVVCNFYFTNFKIIISQLNSNAKLDQNEVIKLGLKNNRTQQEIADFLGINKSTVCRTIHRCNLQQATIPK